MSNESEKKRAEAKFDAACKRLNEANVELCAAEREYGLARKEFDEWWADEIADEAAKHA